VASWSRKADKIRDLLTYHTVLDCRRDKRGDAAYADACILLADCYGITFDGESLAGIKKSFSRGAKVSRTKQFTTRKVGAKPDPDFVKQYCIYCLVCQALQEGNSLRKSYGLAHQQLNGLSPGAIRAIFEKVVHQVKQRPSLNQHKNLIKPR